MKSIPEVVQAFKDDQISAPDLYRTLMAWPAWRVTAEADDSGATRLGVLTDPRGLRVLELFSTPEAVAAFETTENVTADHRTLEIAGYQLFSTLEDEVVQRINIDLHSPHATHFFEGQIPLLRAWAEVVAVELALSAPERIHNPFGVLRRFEGYNVLLRVDGEHRDLVMAPDSMDRTLAAVFTADDTIDEFIGSVGDTLDGELVIERMSGEALFALLDGMPLDGIVFNPLTHLQPVALSAGVIERILEA